jgi:hypothetical protein
MRRLYIISSVNSPTWPLPNSCIIEPTSDIFESSHYNEVINAVSDRVSAEPLQQIGSGGLLKPLFSNYM